jgi:hypothetical protein
MRPTLISCLLAVTAAAPLAAQDTTIRRETRIKADDARILTISGCLGGGAPNFVLTNVTAATVPGGKKGDQAVAATGLMNAYALVPREGVSLAAHVGQRVQIVGVVVEAATKGDADAKIEVRERTEVEREGAPDARTETTTKARIPRGPTAQFAVTSVKMISPVCIE